MRQRHIAGEKAFVDYSGKRIAIVDPTTGEIHEAEIFVGVLGASNLTYAEATWTQQLPDWTGAHVRMFRFFGGVPKLLVPDNLKSGVNKASFYDPEINRTYGAMAAHYSVGILPARPGKPRDKAKVEAGVRFAQKRRLPFPLSRRRIAERTWAIIFSFAKSGLASRLVVGRTGVGLAARSCPSISRQRDLSMAGPLSRPIAAGGGGRRPAFTRVRPSTTLGGRDRGPPGDQAAFLPATPSHRIGPDTSCRGKWRAFHRGIVGP